MDAIDRQIAAALQLNGRATWREVARVIGTSESTVARRGRFLLDSKLVRVTAQPDPARLGLGYPVIVRVQCEAGVARDVARLLAGRPDVRFLSLVTGTTDIMLELIVPTRAHLARVLFEEFSRANGVVGTSTDVVVRTFKTSYDWSRELLGDQAVDDSFGEEIRAPAVTSVGPLDVDSTDMHLIQLLREDGRLTYTELAHVLEMSESMVRRRFSALLGSGAISMATLVDPHALGYEVEALVSLQVDLGKLDEIAVALSDCREIRYLAATSGASDFVCEVILRSPSDLYSFMTDVLGSLDGLRNASIAHELVSVKRAYIESGELLADSAEGNRRDDDHWAL